MFYCIENLTDVVCSDMDGWRQAGIAYAAKYPFMVK